MQVDLKSGLMRGVRQIASPNRDARPAGVEADLIVVHGISLPPGEFGGPWIDRLFTNTLPADVHTYFAEISGLRVSSHLVVMRDGAVTQYVGFTERAWHAGKSLYQGREACNDFSVGVELEGTDTLPYEPTQYVALAEDGGDCLRLGLLHVFGAPWEKELLRELQEPTPCSVF